MIITDFRLFEAMEPYQNCVIYFLSAEDENGEKKLYATISTRMISKGSTYVAKLGNDVYRVYKEDGIYKIKKVTPLTKTFKKSLSISGDSLYLNDNKTPFHKESRFHKNIMDSLSKLGQKIETCYRIDFKQ